MSTRPELAELSCALETLSREEVRYMCMQLEVESHTLNTIDCNHRHDALTCITKYLEAWLDCDGCLTWTKVVEVLKSKRLNKSVLADRIMKKYCSSSSAAIAIASPSCQSSSTSSMSWEDVSSVSSDSSSPDFEASSSSQCASLHQPDQETPHPILSSQPAVSKPEGYKLIRKEAYGLMKKFRSVVIKANVCLIEKEVSHRYLQHFKIDLTKLPMLTKYKKLRFLQKKKRKIMRAKSIQDVFDILDPYWNYVDYSLLEYIVKKYCDGYVKKQMQKYKRKLHQFEKETVVKDFTSALPDNRAFPEKYSTLQATLKVDATQCTLHRIRKVKESIDEKASLQPYVTLIQSIYTRSVFVTIIFPRAARKHVKKSLNRTFLQGLDIIPESVCYRDTKSVKAPDKDTRIPIMSQLSIQGNFHSTAMPDPPQDVREELTYTIRRCDLKPVYRDSEPQLVQNHCSEIESKLKICIQVQWKPDKLEFHIAGPEEGVTRALHATQAEFEEPRSATHNPKALLDFDDTSQQPPTTLTEEALREHEPLTSFRLFSCEVCSCEWWSDISSSKEISRCKQSTKRAAEAEMTVMVEEQQSVVAAKEMSCTDNDETISVDMASKQSAQDEDDNEENDQEIIRSILTDGNYEISPEDHSILESIVTSDAAPPELITAKHAKEIDVMMSDDEDETVSLHDFLILRSILNDCNYDISPEDRSALDSVITTITI